MTDLANLFISPAATPAFAQGVLVTFDPLTGANSVNVGGSVFSNLPLLNMPDVINMTVGSVVMLAQLGGSYAIMGRVVVPGSAVLNTSALQVMQSHDGQLSFALSPAPTTRATASVTAPTWANKVSIIAAGTISGQNSSGAADFLYMQLAIVTGAASEIGAHNTVTQVPSGAVGAVAFPYAITLPCLGGDTISVGAQPSTGASTWSSSVNNVAEATMLALFQRV